MGEWGMSWERNQGYRAGPGGTRVLFVDPAPGLPGKVMAHALPQSSLL